MAATHPQKLKTVLFVVLSFLIISLAFCTGFLFGREGEQTPIQIYTCE